MSRKVLDSNIGENDVDIIMNNIIAQNPQLNAQIEQVRNENNIFLCRVLRIYSYEDKAYVKILNTNTNVFCRLSHEIIGSGMSIDYLPEGVEKLDTTFYRNKYYIEPYDDLYGIVMKVRWENLTDENVLIGYVNIHDKSDLKSNSDKGEISIKSGSSTISVDNERVNIMTPSLFINGLPYDEPELKNYYDKNESSIITNSLTEQINNLDEEINSINERIDNLPSGSGGSSDEDLSEYVRKDEFLDLFDVDFNYNWGNQLLNDDSIMIELFLKEKSDGDGA